MSPTTDTRTGSAEDRTVVASRRHNAAFWIVGYTFAVTMAFSALPTPLYVLYQTRDHFSTFMITVIFAAYAVGVVAGLFLGSYIGLAIPLWPRRRDAVAVLAGVRAWPGRLARRGDPRGRPAPYRLIRRMFLVTPAGSWTRMSTCEEQR